MGNLPPLGKERRRREIEPTQSMLRSALLEDASSDDERYAQQRMQDMYELIEKLMTWFDDVQRLKPETAMQLMGMGAAVTKVLDFKDRLLGGGDKDKGKGLPPPKTAAKVDGQSRRPSLPTHSKPAFTQAF